MTPMDLESRKQNMFWTCDEVQIVFRSKYASFGNEFASCKWTKRGQVIPALVVQLGSRISYKASSGPNVAVKWYPASLVAGCIGGGISKQLWVGIIFFVWSLVGWAFACLRVAASITSASQMPQIHGPFLVTLLSSFLAHCTGVLITHGVFLPLLQLSGFEGLHGRVGSYFYQEGTRKLLENRRNAK